MLPIWRVGDAKLIYESLKENQHEINPYQLDNLQNGKNYQIGIFPMTKDNVICLSPIQLIAQPRYIRPRQIINYDYLITEQINNDKNIYMNDGKIDIGLFTWENEAFVTHKNTVLWFEALYPLVEGGKLKFTVNNDQPCIIRVYIDRLNIFTLTEDRRHVYYSSKDFSFKELLLNEVSSNKTIFLNNINNNKNNGNGNENNDSNNGNNNGIIIDLPPREYCKIIIDVQSEYNDFTISLSNIELSYNTSRID